jgi:hypothetical protein
MPGNKLRPAAIVFSVYGTLEIEAANSLSETHQHLCGLSGIFLPLGLLFHAVVESR